MKLINGDCKEEIKKIAENSIDAIITDPPYEIGILNNKWDKKGIAFCVELWKECLRVLKPGGHLLSFSSPRTYHRIANAIETSSFEIRDMIEWVYGEGLPKGVNIGKVAKNDEWKGYSTSLKPAHEPICMARKPLEKGLSVVQNCLKWGTGGLNIDDSRIDVAKDDKNKKVNSKYNQRNPNPKGVFGDWVPAPNTLHLTGRYPANLIHDGSDEIKECFPNNSSRYFKSIIYNAKTKQKERHVGCDNLPNNHPAIKPIALMEYLVNMVSREKQTILDPFMGSGTTGIACKTLNRNFIGIEIDKHYFAIAKARIGGD